MGFESKQSGWRWAVGVMVFVAVAVGAFGQSAPAAARSREFPPGALKAIEELPAGRFRTQIDKLPAASRQQALERLQRFHFTELDLESLNADADGGVFYVDQFTIAPNAAASPAPITIASAIPVSPFPAQLIFHSRPGAPNTLFINFSGESVSGTAWNTSLGRSVIPALAFNTDFDNSTFSDSEQLAIKRIWQRVSEDYTPFDVDVTTERPANFTTRTAMALVTESTDANGALNPSGATAGGVAYVNVFNNFDYATSRPAWIYTDNLADDESYISEAVSHEIGHNMGLSHDGKTDGAPYYGGHGTGDISWGPIMGTGYDRNVSQWSKGEYYLANNTQDDLAIIAAKVGYRAADNGGTRATATQLMVTGGTSIVSTTPEDDPTNANPANKGVLSTNAEVDVFSFATGSGPVSLYVNPWISPSGVTRGGNLDILLELYDAKGTLLLTNNPFSATTAGIQAALAEGVYYLYVRNAGVGTPLSSTPTGYTSYGSVGQYFISGSITVAPPQALLQVSDITQVGTGPKQFTVTYFDNVPMDVATIDTNDLRVIGPNNFDRQAQLISVNIASNGSPRVATYSVNPPVGGVWSNANNGIYTISMRSGQVKDSVGVSVAAGQLGLFTVNVPTPVFSDKLDVLSGWTLTPNWDYGAPVEGALNGPVSGFTGPNVIGYNLAGNYERSIIFSKYATTPVFDCSSATSLTLRFQRWLRVRSGDTASIQISANGGSSWTDVWVSSGNVLDNSWQQFQYDVSASAAGSPSVQVRWGMLSDNTSASQNDIGWNIDDVEVIRGGSSGQFATNYALTATVNNPLWGTVSPSGATFAAGSSSQVVATPAAYYRFANWSGDASGSGNPLTVVLSTNLAVQAVFAEILTTNHPTPYGWLASNGFTQNFETVVTNVGANKMPLWQSYIAGLNPNDPASQLRLSLTPAVGGTSVVLNWDSVTGRVYTVSSSTNLTAGFLTLANATNLPYPVNRITNSVGPSIPLRLYRLEVRKP